MLTRHKRVYPAQSTRPFPRVAVGKGSGYARLPKQVTCYENSENPSRCLVKLFQKYVSQCPSEPTCFYLTPVRKIKNNIFWYSKTPVGHNTLAGTVSRICKKAGVSGYKTNHSLRVTSATRLFQNGIDEQLIMSNILDIEVWMEFDATKK